MSISSLDYQQSIFWMAENLAKKATCPRRSVGCVIVKPHGALLVDGYNGAPEGLRTCNEIGCLIEGGHCVRAVHAEIRALASAVKAGISLNGCVAFCTLLPCIQCMQALLLGGVRSIFYDESYEREEKNHLHHLADAAGVVLIERIR